MAISVLVIEDNRLDVMAFERVIRAKGQIYEYDVAKSVADALITLEEKSYDVIICDYKLPDDTGFVILEQIETTPVIFMTAYGDEHIAVRAMRAGASDYIIKDKDLTYVNLLPLTIEKVVSQDLMAKRLHYIEFERNLSGIMVFDAQGKLTDCNQTCIDVLEQADKAQIVGSDWDELLLEDFDDILRRLQANEFIHGHPLTINTNGEEPRYAVANVATISDIRGHIQSIQVVFIDITAQKSMENRLIRLKEAIESSTVGITISDANLPDMPLTYVNPAFEKLTGYTLAESIGRNCRFLQADDNDQPGLMEIRYAIANKKSARVILRNYRKDGTMFWNQLTISPVLDQNHQLTHFIGVQHDVTLEQEFNTKLEQERVQVLTTFIQDAAHEFRTPLSVISTSGQIMTRISDEAGRQRRYQRIVDQVSHITKLIDTLLLMIKLESHSEVAHEPVQLMSLLEQVIQRIQSQYTSIPTITTKFENENLTIWGDYELMLEALNQVIDNAVRYTLPDGLIHINVFTVNNVTQIVIQDTGEGISADNLDSIFETFWRKDTAHTTPGLGLGLPIARRILEKLSGSIRVESVEQQGTTVGISLKQLVD